MRALQHIRQVWLQSPSINMFAIATIIAILQTQEVIVNIAQIVKHVAETHILRMFAYLIFICATMLFFPTFAFRHRVSRFHGFNPFPVGWQTRNQAVTLEMPATVIGIV
ncbi:MAG: hypothetical protein MJE68_14305 [Proteobacteria bacterium]|nr:hypothetical protein [Pseudomonadota bacterium]